MRADTGLTVGDTAVPPPRDYHPKNYKDPLYYKYHQRTETPPVLRVNKYNNQQYKCHRYFKYVQHSYRILNVHLQFYL